MENKSTLRAGDFHFVSLDAINEGFSIEVNQDIAPHSSIHFTDSEWSGNHFGADESDIVWETGSDTLRKGTIITFNKLDRSPSVSIGKVKNTMSISKKSEAIFAYKGTSRMPDRFIAAVANDSSGFGTLINTGLEKSHIRLFLN